MKTSKYILLASLMGLGLSACQNDDIVVTYPDSAPSIASATVSGISIKSTDTNIIYYNDSIELNVTIEDKVAPLSTLEIMVAVNNEVLHQQSVRTKGNSATVKEKYAIPFGPNMPDNIAVEVYLTSINVSGFKTESIITTLKVLRPITYEELYIVPASGKAIKLPRLNPESLEYGATGLELPNDFSYRITNKVDRFGKINWNDPEVLVWGKVGEGIGLIDVYGEQITVQDPRIEMFDVFTFDALAFKATMSGRELMPITDLNVNTKLKAKKVGDLDVLEGLVYFGTDVETLFTGITDVATGLSPDFFEVTGGNKAKFLGATGVYRTIYFIDDNYLYVEQPDAKYPNVIWICGNGFGLPFSTTARTTSSWNWNSPLDYSFCRTVSPNIFQVTLYLENTVDAEALFGALNFKFFHQRMWGGEALSTGNTVDAPLISREDEGNVGNWGTGTTPFSGIYRITLNLNNNTTQIVKIN